MQLNYQTRGTNLHSFWDSGIISSENITFSDYLNTKSYTPEELKAIKTINLVGWNDESRSLLDKVYSYGNPKVQDKYVTDSSRIIETQIQKAGIRIGFHFTDVFLKVINPLGQ